MSEQLMTAAVHQGKGNIVLEKRPVPRLLHPQDAIIKVTLTAICSDDIHIKHGVVSRVVSGIILGHEFMGIVEKVGAGVKGVRPGDRVAVNVETFRGERYFCKRSYMNDCMGEHGGQALGYRIDGGQSEHVEILFVDNGPTKIPDLVTDEAALFTGDLFSTGCRGAVLAEIKPADTVVALGAGLTGLYTLMCVRLYGLARVIAVGVSDERPELAKARGLADVTLNPLSRSVEQETLRLTGGRGANAVLRVAGGRDIFQTTWKIARPNAVVRVVAMCGEAQTLPLLDMYGKNLVFKTDGMDASCCGQIMELTRVGRLDTGCLTTHRITLDHITEAYDVPENEKDHVIEHAIKMEQGEMRRAEFFCKQLGIAGSMAETVKWGQKILEK